MPQFDDIRYVTLTGTLNRADGTPATGVVTVSMYLTTQDTVASKLLTLQPRVLTLVNGAFSTLVPGVIAGEAPILELNVLIDDARPDTFLYKLVTSADTIDISQLDGFESSSFTPEPLIFVAWSSVGVPNGLATLGPDGNLTPGQSPLTAPPVNLVYAPSILTNAGLGTHFRVTLTGNPTLANPTGATDGQKIMWELVQDGTGGRVLTLDTKFAFGSDLPAVVLSTVAGRRDFLGVVYNQSADKFFVLALAKGF